MRWVLLFVVLAGCGDDDLRVVPPRDAGPRVDSGTIVRPDAGMSRSDGGFARDAGSGMDAGRRDAGLVSRDAGSIPGIDGSIIPGLDGSIIPSLDGSIPGGCMSAADCEPGSSCCAIGPVMICIPLPMCPF
jgi:hypothetical protein